ncbi:MAG: hypothetical protein Ct9H90mP18_10200 [Gammaproteobacteria bacterium]|nr:MAG: hypothetical protein Ct9H90mP18_10200 [Gammaproteobacteria bacterium]
MVFLIFYKCEEHTHYILFSKWLNEKNGSNISRGIEGVDGVSSAIRTVESEYADDAKI